MRKALSYISNISLTIAFVIGIYAIVSSYILRSKLPLGVCPVTNNRPWIYTAIALCCISFILSFFDKKQKQ